jgi:hypothetical protein
MRHHLKRRSVGGALATMAATAAVALMGGSPVAVAGTAHTT